MALGSNSIYYLPLPKTGNNSSSFSLLSGSSCEEEEGKDSQTLETARNGASAKESGEGIGSWPWNTV